MRKSLQLIITVLVLGVIVTGCGSGGGSGSKLAKNEYLGKLPAIYEQHQIALDESEAEIEKKAEKLLAGGTENYPKLMKMSEEYEAVKKEIKDKFKTDVAEENKKLVGKEIPVTFSDSLKNSGKLYYEIKPVKLIEKDGELKYAIAIVAKEDLNIPRMKGYDYTVYWRELGENGSVISKSMTCTMPVPLDTKALTYQKGDVLLEIGRSFTISVSPAEYSKFSGIEFISEEQYKSKMGFK